MIGSHFRLMVSIHEDGFKFVNYRTKEVMMQFTYSQVRFSFYLFFMPHDSPAHIPAQKR
jgi:hypothetical protein